MADGWAPQPELDRAATPRVRSSPTAPWTREKDPGEDDHRGMDDRDQVGAVDPTAPGPSASGERRSGISMSRSVEHPEGATALGFSLFGWPPRPHGRSVAHATEELLVFTCRSGGRWTEAARYRAVDQPSAVPDDRSGLQLHPHHRPDIQAA